MSEDDSRLTYLIQTHLQNKKTRLLNDTTRLSTSHLCSNSNNNHNNNHNNNPSHLIGLDYNQSVVPIPEIQDYNQKANPNDPKTLIPKEDGTLWTPEEYRKDYDRFFGNEWQLSKYTRQLLLNKNPDYQFLRLVAGFARIPPELVYEEDYKPLFRQLTTSQQVSPAIRGSDLYNFDNIQVVLDNLKRRLITLDDAIQGGLSFQSSLVNEITMFTFLREPYKRLTEDILMADNVYTTLNTLNMYVDSFQLTYDNLENASMLESNTTIAGYFFEVFKPFLQGYHLYHSQMETLYQTESILNRPYYVGGSLTTKKIGDIRKDLMAECYEALVLLFNPTKKQPPLSDGSYKAYFIDTPNNQSTLDEAWKKQYKKWIQKVELIYKGFTMFPGIDEVDPYEPKKSVDPLEPKKIIFTSTLVNLEPDEKYSLSLNYLISLTLEIQTLIDGKTTNRWSVFVNCVKHTLIFLIGIFLHEPDLMNKTWSQLLRDTDLNIIKRLHTRTKEEWGTLSRHTSTLFYRLTGNVLMTFLEAKLITLPDSFQVYDKSGEKTVMTGEKIADTYKFESVVLANATDYPFEEYQKLSRAPVEGVTQDIKNKRIQLFERAFMKIISTPSYFSADYITQTEMIAKDIMKDPEAFPIISPAWVVSKKIEDYLERILKIAPLYAKKKLEENTRLRNETQKGVDQLEDRQHALVSGKVMIVEFEGYNPSQYWLDLPQHSGYLQINPNIQAAMRAAYEDVCLLTNIGQFNPTLNDLRDGPIAGDFANLIAINYLLHGARNSTTYVVGKERKKREVDYGNTLRKIALIYDGSRKRGSTNLTIHKKNLKGLSRVPDEDILAKLVMPPY